MIDDLDPNLTPIKYTNSIEYKYNSDFRNKVTNNETIEIGTNYTLLANDAQFSAMIVGSFGANKEAKTFGDASTTNPVLIVAEVDEVSPLARAEWVKVLALYLNVPAKGNQIFKNVETRYIDIRKKAAAAIRRPSVFFNYPSVPFSSTWDPAKSLDENYEWYQPGGKTYIGAYARDANADYRFEKDGKSISSALKFSNISELFSSARYLLNSVWIPEVSGRTYQQFVSNGSRKPGEADTLPLPRDAAFEAAMKKFDAVRCKSVFGISARIFTSALGNSANDFFEEGILRPDRVLADYVSILHPNVDLDGHSLYFMNEYTQPDSLELTCPYKDLVIGPKEGNAYVDIVLKVAGLNRFEIQDKLESAVFPEMKKQGIDVDMVDVQFSGRFAQDSNGTTLQVRQEVPIEDALDTSASKAVDLSFSEALGVDVVRQGSSVSVSPSVSATPTPSTSVSTSVSASASASTNSSPSPSSSIASTIAASPAVVPPPASPSPSGSSVTDAQAGDKDDGGLSTGAIVGIVLGSLVVLVVALFLVFWVRNRNASASAAQYSAMAGSTEAPVSA